MGRGRRRIYDEPLSLSLKCERRIHDAMVYLKYSDSDVYTKGALMIMDERVSELTPESIEIVIKETRKQMKDVQNRISYLERMVMDAQIKQERQARMKKKTVILHDDRGNEILAVSAD